MRKGAVLTGLAIVHATWRLPATAQGGSFEERTAFSCQIDRNARTHMNTMDRTGELMRRNPRTFAMTVAQNLVRNDILLDL